MTWTHIPQEGVGHRGDCLHSFILDLLFAASGQSLGKCAFPEPLFSPVEERTELARYLHSNSQASWIHVPAAELHPGLSSIACAPDYGLSAKCWKPQKFQGHEKVFGAVLVRSCAWVGWQMCGDRGVVCVLKSPCRLEGWGEKCSQKFLFRGTKPTQ